MVLMRINIAVIGFLALAGLGQAATVAVVNDGGGDPTGHSNYDVAGWDFTTSDPITVTSLGIFVSNGTLTENHQVGIYPGGGGANLAITTILGGAVPDAQGYAYVSLITPLDLAGNRGYFIGAYYNERSPDFMRDVGNFSVLSMASGLTFHAADVYYTSSAFNPSTTANASGHFSQGGRASYFGPNFQFDVTIPEPGTFWLLGLSSICLLIARRRLARS
jgi:hypothetical protein